MSILNLITILVGAIGGLGGVGTFLYYKQNKSSATADAINKSAEAMGNMNTFIASQQMNFNNIIEQKDTIIDAKRIMIDKNKEELKEQKRKIDEYDYRIATLERQNKGLSDQIGILMARLELSEGNKCTVDNCPNREPPKKKTA
jgi:uncharacterized protein HemX